MQPVPPSARCGRWGGFRVFGPVSRQRGWTGIRRASSSKNHAPPRRIGPARHCRPHRRNTPHRNASDHRNTPHGGSYPTNAATGFPVPGFYPRSLDVRLHLPNSRPCPARANPGFASSGGFEASTVLADAGFTPSRADGIRRTPTRLHPAALHPGAPHPGTPSIEGAPHTTRALPHPSAPSNAGGRGGDGRRQARTEPSDDQPQQQHRHPANDRHDGLHQRPRLQSLRHRQAEILFEQPEPRIIDVREKAPTPWTGE